ncbi:MAG: hypothetical protein C0483_04700 [Pirellula sp.]|nr:hypothetical protein [Pirellula sp.]
MVFHWSPTMPLIAMALAPRVGQTDFLDTVTCEEIGMIHPKLKLIACGTMFLLCSGCSRDPGATTHAYWNELMLSLAVKAEKQPDERTQVAADARASATAMENLPTAGVDIEAARIALTGARLQREYAELVTQEGVLPGFVFMDGFMWGLTGQGSPFDTAAQYSGAVSAWRGRVQAWFNDSQVVRMELTHKYGKEFPTLLGSSTSTSANGGAVAQQSFLSQLWSEFSSVIACVAILTLIVVANYFFFERTK